MVSVNRREYCEHIGKQVHGEMDDSGERIAEIYGTSNLVFGGSIYPGGFVDHTWAYRLNQLICGRF